MTRPPTPPPPPPLPPLPARVRVSRLPLPPSAAVAVQLARLCPGARLETLTGAAVALAGGRVVGALLSGPDGTELMGVDASWRGKGLEAALRAELGGAEPDGAELTSAGS